MGAASLALFYVVFALLFVYLNLASLSVPSFGAVYRTVQHRYATRPLSLPGKPEKYMDDLDQPVELLAWLQHVFKEVTHEEQRPTPNGTLSHATVGSFNRVLMVRMTAKRWKLETNTKGRFKAGVARNEYPTVLSGRMLNAAQVNAAEDTEPACQRNGSEPCFAWQEEGTFDEKGGYVVYFNPTDGPEAFEKLLAEWRQADFFDLRLGTFTVDMMVYNTNVDLFVHVAWSFAFDFAGNCHRSTTARSFNLNLFNTQNSTYLMQYMLRYCLVGFVVVFILNEFMKVAYVGILQHLRQGGSWIDATSLLLCIIVLMTYWIMETDSIFGSFSFDQLLDPATRPATYSAMESLAKRFEEQKFIIALNLLIVFVRAVVLVAELQSNLGLMLKVMEVCINNLLYFNAMFLVIMAGFVLFAYFTFGSGFYLMSTVSLSFYTTFSMLTGKPVYEDLESADPVMAPIFYYCYYVFFYLVMINMFVSILMSGYDVVDHRLKQRNVKEENPFRMLMHEIQHDVIDRVSGFVKVFFAAIYWCMGSVIDALEGCFKSCIAPFLPSKETFSALPGLSRSSRTDPRISPHESRSRSGLSEDEKGSRRRHQAFNPECVCMVIFMLNFILLMSLQTRGLESFLAAQATGFKTAKQANLAAMSDAHVEDFDDISSFEGVRAWTEYVIKGLYTETRCVVSVDGAEGPSLLAPGEGCNNGNNTEQLVQVLKNWNVGFLNTTFVRLTIQPACYVPNPEARWAAGYPWLRKTPDVSCAFEDCTRTLAEHECQTPDGGSLSDLDDLYVGNTSGVKYNFSQPQSELGAYGLLGGFAFSLGSTGEECEAKLQELDRDNWFSKKSASMVFDWITYNGNLDMFTYNRASFSQLPTGAMSKEVHAQAIPMNIDQGGGYFNSDRTWILILFSVYTFFVLCYILEFAVRIQKGLSRHEFRLFLHNFFGNPWNLSDLLSLILSIVSIVYFIMFATLPFRKYYKFSVDGRYKFQVPNDDEKKFNMSKSTDPGRFLEDDWYIFLQFERAEALYRTFLIIAAINSFFISIKVVKFVGDMGMVAVFSNTLDSGKERNIYFAIIILLLLAGFALFFHILFGHAVTDLASWGGSIVNLLEWMIGEYDLLPLMEVNPTIATLFFVAFMVGLYFVAVNMFLATMLTVYCDTVGRLDVQHTHEQMIKTRTILMVEYRDKEDFKADVTELALEEGELVVKDLEPEGTAAKLGVMKGHIIFKINGDRKGFRDYDTVEKVLEEGIQEENGVIEVVFKDNQRRDQGLGRLLSRADPEDEGSQVKPTVKNFWRSEGAVTFIAREVSSMETTDVTDEYGDAEGLGEGGLEEEEEAGGEGSEFDDEANGRKHPEAARKAAMRLRTKKRLDALLFSRWMENRRSGPDGAGGTGHGWESFGGSEEKPQDINYEAEEGDLAKLREIMAKVKVTGQEAWLDCLVAAIERDMEDESVVADVLRTSEMQELGMKGSQAGKEKKSIQEFYRHADEVLKMLEYKANKKYYQHLQLESEQRQDLLRRQNDVLHEYVCELEKEFTKVMEQIHGYRAKKQVMLTKLAGLLDRSAYRHLDRTAANQDDSHMRRLDFPWPESRMQGMPALEEGSPR